MVGDLGGFDFHLPGVAVCVGQGGLDLYEPFYSVDIGDFIDDRDGITVTAGESLDVNDAGLVVGWYEDGFGKDVPFVLDPLDGGSLMTVSMTDSGVSLQSAHMTAINNSTTGDPLDSTIVGWGIATGQSIHEPIYYSYDVAGSQWVPHLIFSGHTTEGEALAVNDSGLVTGWTGSAAVPSVLHYDISSNTYADWGPGIGYDIRSSGQMIVGDDINHPSGFVKAFVQNGSDPDYQNGDRTLLTGGGNPLSHARGINFSRNILGSAGIGVQDQKAWAWNYNPGTQGWDDLMLSPLPSLYHVALVEDINDTNEAVGNYLSPTNVAGGFYIVGYVVTGSTVWDAINLDGMVLYSHTKDALGQPRNLNAIIDRAYALNNRSWIAASFEPDRNNGSVYRPCVLVPNDVDNNGIPDMREILQERLKINGTELDVNGNWLLDWAENDSADQNISNMRVGLHAPGLDGSSTASGTYTQEIDQVQIVRFIMNTTSLLSQQQQNFPAMETIQDVIDPLQSVCQIFSDNINNWGQGMPPTNDQREIILTIRSVDDQGPFPNRDTIPADPTAKKEVLDSIRAFSYRYAHCVDYMEFGNEVWGGAGGYAFLAGRLQCDQAFQGTIDNVTEACFTEAVQVVLQWLGDQTEAARIGSALAGRPLRFFSGGVQDGFLSQGSNGNINGPFKLHDPVDNDNRAAHIVNEVGKYANGNRLYFDLHIYYLMVDEDETLTTDSVAEHLDKIKATGNWTGVPWNANVPIRIGTLELGPHPDTDELDPNPLDDWWKGNGGNVPLYQTAGNQGQLEFDFWKDYQNDWETNDTDKDGQFQGPGFRLGDVFSNLKAHGFTMACYAATLEPSKGLPDEWQMSALRAQNVDADYFVPGNQVEKFTPLRTKYENDALPYQIPNFIPHPQTCDCADVCDSCQP